MSDDKAAGFLDDIVANVDDDAPRLIFADWLTDHGDPERGEFIRVQCERATLPEWDRRRLPLLLRERALLREHGPRWRAGLPRTKAVEWGEFRRGFVATALFRKFSTFLQRAAKCWAATPLEAVTVAWPRQDDPTDALEPIAGLRELTINGTLVDPRDIRRLADSPLLRSLRALNIPDGEIGPDGFDRIVKSPHLENLRALRVPRNSIGNGGIDSLVAARRLTSLEELDLSEAGSYGRYGEDPIIGADGMEALAAWPGLSRLRSLTLSGNEIGRAGLEALLGSPGCVNLKTLVLRANGLRGRDMQALEAAQDGPRLDVLDLGENLLRDSGLRCVADAACLAELKTLHLDRCEVTFAAATASDLAEAAFYPTLRKLDLSSNELGTLALYTLLEKGPAELHTIRLSDAGLDAEAVAQLANSAGSDSLLALDLSSNELGEDAAEALADAAHLRSLLVLCLFDNDLAPAAVEKLAASPLGRRLARLEMGLDIDETEGLPW